MKNTTTTQSAGICGQSANSADNMRTKTMQQKALLPPEPKSWLQYSIGRNQRKDRKTARRRRAAGLTPGV